MFSSANLLLALIVFAARVVDVSLGTFRHAMIIRGRRLPAFILAFFESLIWVYAVSRVIAVVTDPLTALAFAAGFATGTVVGITIENFFKIGEQVIRVFSPAGEAVAAALREQGFPVTMFQGQGRDGRVDLLFIQVKRRLVKKVFSLARVADPSCFLVVDDIREVSRLR